MQPCLVFVGKKQTAIERVYIKWGVYSCSYRKGIDAFNTLFQIYNIINLEYPKDCYNLWILVQHCVYEIVSKHDKKVTSIISLEQSLKRMKSKDSS